MQLTEDVPLTLDNRHQPLTMRYLPHWLGLPLEDVVMPLSTTALYVTKRKGDLSSGFNSLSRSGSIDTDCTPAYLKINLEGDRQWLGGEDPRHYDIVVVDPKSSMKMTPILMITRGPYLEPLLHMEDGSKYAVEGVWGEVFGNSLESVDDMIMAAITHEFSKRAGYNAEHSEGSTLQRKHGVENDAIIMALNNFVLYLPGASENYSNRFTCRKGTPEDDIPYKNLVNCEGFSESFKEMTPRMFRTTIEFAANSVGFDRGAFEKAMTTAPRDYMSIKEMALPVLVKLLSMEFTSKDLLG